MDGRIPKLAPPIPAAAVPGPSGLGWPGQISRQADQGVQYPLAKMLKMWSSAPELNSSSSSSWSTFWIIVRSAFHLYVLPISIDLRQVATLPWKLKIQKRINDIIWYLCLLYNWGGVYIDKNCHSMGPKRIQPGWPTRSTRHLALHAAMNHEERRTLSQHAAATKELRKVERLS